MNTYKVEGMTCGGCAASITRALKAIVPEANIEVDHEKGTVRVEGMEAEAVRACVEDAGFEFCGLC